MDNTKKSEGINTSKILYGKPCAEKVLLDVKKNIEKFLLNGVVPHFAVLVAKDDYASMVYVNMKVQKAKELGISSTLYYVDQNTTTEDVVSEIVSFNQRKDIHGILVQLPLPKQIDKDCILSKIDPSKDIDGLTSFSMGRLAMGLNGLFPATAEAVMELLDFYQIKLLGKRVLMIGMSNIVGKPLSLMLLGRKATVTCAHKDTKDLKRHCMDAEIIFTAVGKPEYIQKEWVSEGCILIDIGYSRVEGRSGDVGDVDYNSVLDHVSMVTPVPGGVGPITVACLMKNIVKAIRI